MAGKPLSFLPAGMLGAFLLVGAHLIAQPCLTGYSLTASTPPNGGTYACGETVTFCLTVSNWSTTNANWFHGVAANFGPGWDLATLQPGPPPATAGGSAGTWGWYNSVQGTAGTALGPQGPGFFFDLNNDGNPGNNFGDFSTGSWTFCWTISVLSGAACVNGLDLGVAVNTFGDSETGSWGSSGCGSDVVVPSQPAVIQACTADAGLGNALGYCSTSGPIDLFALLTGTPDPTGTWSDPAGQPHSGTLDPATQAAGDYTYTVSSVNHPCSASAVISISITPQPSAGSDGAITMCSNDAPINLLSAISGLPDAGGSWMGPAGAASATFNPAQDLPGVYTYSLSPAAPCVAVASTVTVTVHATPSAGIGNTLFLCDDAVPSDLFMSLSGSPDINGSWFAPDGSPSDGIFDAGIDPTGDYTYVVNGLPPCPADQATITVSVQAAPEAGGDAAVTLCATGTAQLSTLLTGTPDPGGSWLGPDGALVSSPLDLSTAVSGSYLYSITAMAPCVSAQAILALTLVPEAHAGGDATVTLCEASDPLDLFASITGAPDPGGSWTGPDGPTNGMYVPATDAPGVFTYVVAGQTPCPDASSSVLVELNPQPYAGTNAALILCSSDGATGLFPLLGPGAAPDGAWTGPDGLVSDGFFLPGVSSDGSFTYTVMGLAPCPDASAQVAVSTVAAADAGSDGALLICETAAPTSLFAQLNGTPQPGGTWTSPAGAVTSGSIDPATAVSGPYTYTINGSAPCPSASATVTLSVVSQPDAGQDGNVQLCSDASAPASLFNALIGSPTAGGTWTAPSGAPHNDQFNVTTDAVGSYTYWLTASAPCVSVSSMVTVNVSQAPDAGPDMVVALCSAGDPIDPNTLLNPLADPNGVWLDPAGNPITAIDPSVMPAGLYAYSVTGTPPCVNDQASLYLQVDQMPSAGTASLVELCADAGPMNLIDAMAGFDSGGSWSGPAGSSSGWFDPASDAAGAYSYTVMGSGACEGLSDVSTVVLVVNPVPVPAFTVDVLAGCAPLQAVLTNWTTGPVAHVDWLFGDGSSSVGDTSAMHTYTIPGLYLPSITVTDTNGCVATLVSENAILVSGGPAAAFSAWPERVSASNATTVITHHPAPNATYAWVIDGTVIDTSGVFLWTFSPATIGEHEVCLLATDTLGCVSEACERVRVEDDLTVFTANAFTPNGDGHNDGFRPSTLGVEKGSYDFKVFDRWGLLVFSTSDPLETWDGTMGNAGDPLPQDVYVWTLRAKDVFAPVLAELVGTVTLLR